MKSEHRHDLQTNDLSKLMVQAEPFMEKYGVKAVVAAGVIFVVVIGYFSWSSSRSDQDAEGWTLLAACTSTADFETVAEDYSGTKVAQWALVHAAESHLQSGIRNSFTDRSAGDRDLTDAKEQFQQLLDSSSTLPEIRERALFGMARTEESVSDGDLKNAIELYQKLIQEYPESIFRKLAEQRVKPVEGEKVAVLDQEATKKFYKWFHAQTPKPGDRQQPGFNLPMPGGAAPGGAPTGSTETPRLPALPGLPSLPGLPAPVTSSPQPTEKKTEDKKPDDAKPAAPAKADSKPAEKPAAPEASAKKADTPAEKPKSEPATEKKP
ncbi:tetratricopeptide repeat protein [uncultured Gimesia sp.]|uniref:tetratricopeptide repeat protein n=1 Tax=uncultured Gimesia sp. TaxID=1678688 RepID=UPI0030D8A010|tara:strand:+ start:11130 stop:12098 length:969 start_codon:yes stop_codon:yes gene_type:complete